MSQNRNLVPLTVYLPPELLAKIEKQAAKTYVATATQVRSDLVALYARRR